MNYSHLSLEERCGIGILLGSKECHRKTERQEIVIYQLVKNND